MTDNPGESPEPRPTSSTPTTPPADAPSLLDLPEPPPAPPAPPPPPGRATSWSEPPTQVPPLGSTGYGPPPPPRTAAYPVHPHDRYIPTTPLDPQQERLWAMLAHLTALAALVIGVNFLGPLLVFVVYKDRSEFVRDQAAESLNFQITTIIAGLISLPFVLLGVGILMFLVVFIGWLILSVLAGVAANNGQRFRYPVNLRLIR